MGEFQKEKVLIVIYLPKYISLGICFFFICKYDTLGHKLKQSFMLFGTIFIDYYE